jgi:hypothetical protein
MNNMYIASYSSTVVQIFSSQLHGTVGDSRLGTNSVG